ncbi:MAG: glycosyltransferase family 2 protein [Marinibacterium sp.]|nr:glycosyltransferase family 2 protein [Marinibacterium sp.]
MSGQTVMRLRALKDVVRGARHWAGPVALIVIEDEIAVAETLRHHLQLGFGTLLVLSPDAIALPVDLSDDPRLIPVRYGGGGPGALAKAVTCVVQAMRDGWLYWGYNAEFLYFPQCETRSIGALLAFHAGEQRASLPGMVVDLYTGDLACDPDGVTLTQPLMDAMGYCALPRTDPRGDIIDRQPEIFGGLRRRFAEHVPHASQRIDRVPLIRAGRRVRMGADGRWHPQARNSWSCPWHRNATVAICSFRAAKALRRNPAPRAAIPRFDWGGSVPFDWRSDQLLELGMMEPGQWV